MIPILDRLHGVPAFGGFLGHRFIKFGTVGFLGTIINLVVLYVNQEYTFRAVVPAELRLHLSLAVAIFAATLSNFLWNRNWTWQDRKGKTHHRGIVQLGQYFLASGVAIGIQYASTILLSRVIHYIPANVLAILIAAVFTYLLNDGWTFAVKKKLSYKEKTGNAK